MGQAAVGKTEKGYVRYYVAAAHMAYEHILVARIAWGPRVPWPKGFHVHHQDGRRAHNCRQNLVVIDPRLHDARMHARKPRAAAEAVQTEMPMIEITPEWQRGES